MSGLHWDKAFALEQAADDAELLEELLVIFKDSYKADLALIAEGVAEASAEKICRAAHSIKGAAASLGIEGIRDIALEIESDSRTGGVELAAKQLVQLQQLQIELKDL